MDLLFHHSCVLTVIWITSPEAPYVLRRHLIHAIGFTEVLWTTYGLPEPGRGPHAITARATISRAARNVATGSAIGLNSIATTW
jgi:hypothetical protein